MKRTTQPHPRKPRPDVHHCAKGGMDNPVAKKVVVTMPGGYIA